MKDRIAAIGQEAKYMQNSEDRDNKYRERYVHSLRAVSEFLIGQSARRSYASDNAAVERLFPFASLQRSSRGDYAFVALPNGRAQRDSLEIAANVLRSRDEDTDFLNWLLHTYGTRALSSAGDAVCPMFPNRPAPRNEAELDLLEAELDRRYPEITAIGKGKKCASHNSVTSSTPRQTARY